MEGRVAFDRNRGECGVFEVNSEILRLAVLL
jgi:hypothetical protein